MLTTDNEENGLICIRIIFDLLRNFSPTLENEVQPLLDFVWKIYQNFKLTVSHFFENPAASVEDVKPMEVSTSSDQSMNSGCTGTVQLNPSTRSFKIVTESPLVVMFLFQLYSRLVQTNIPLLLPLMVSAISFPGPEKVPPSLKTHFIELKGAQVKVCCMRLVLYIYMFKFWQGRVKHDSLNVCNNLAIYSRRLYTQMSYRKRMLRKVL